MQIVIDIPEELKQKIDEGFTNQVITNKLWDTTRNGIPLDKIKAEIREHCERHFIDGDIIAADVLEIINKHIGESEDKE